MQCVQCQHDNPQGAKFCNACAAPVIPICPSCTTEIPASANFCHQCATILQAPTSSSASVQCGQQEANLESRFYAALPFVMSALQRERRISYRMLQHAFGLDDGLLAEIRRELIFKKLVVDEDGEGLAWIGEPVGFPSVSISSPIAITESTSEPSAMASELSPPKSSPIDSLASESIRRGPDAERRQITVMFCDLVGSTDLSGQLDPEDLREVVRAYQESAAEVIYRYEGHIAQYLGDGLLIYFGFPVAHEDDAQRAIYTGLGIPDTIAELNTRLKTEYGVELAVRIGIHTGPVVVGEMGGGGRHENLALGETPNIAARLEGLAEANTAVISLATAQLVQRSFILEELGPHELKGVSEPMRLFRVVSHRGIEYDDHESMHAGGFEALVGRDEEIGLLLRRWEQSKEGSGQVVCIMGEAGIGKSSLVGGIRRHVTLEHLPRITMRCSQYHQNSVLYPVINHLQRLLGFEPEDSMAEKLARLEKGLEPYTLPLDETVPLLADLFSITLPDDRYPPLSLSPPQQRQQTLDALNGWMLEEAEHQPLLILWEDLHWADPTSLELLESLIEQAPTSAMLNVLTFRPEFTLSWPTRSHMTSLTLNRLERPQAEALVTRLAAGKSLPSDVMHHIVTKTDGVPFYVEELTKAVIESGVLQEAENHYVLSGPLNEVAIPATLNDSLMARLDRLPMVREIAQLGAVIGREFAYDMLHALANLEEPVLQDGLSQLVAHELLYQRGRPPRATYTFKHALVQDAAYQSLLRRTRQQIHEQIAQLLEASFPEVVEAQPEVVAHHYSEARQIEKAIGYWQQAGRRAIKRSANQEASRHLHNGLELIAAFPNRMAYAEQELDIQITLGPALMAIKGIGSREVEATYARARELCQHIGATAQIFPVLYGLWRFYHTRATYQTAKELGEQLVTLIQDDPNPARAAQAHHALGFTLLYLGELTAARVHLEQAVTFADRTVEDASTLQSGIAPGVTERNVLAQALWSLGYPDQSLQWSLEVRAKVQELEHSLSLATALFFAARIHNLRREMPAVLEQSTELVRFATDQGFGTWIACGNFMHGVAQVTQGKVEVSLDQMRQSLIDVLGTGSEIFRVPFLIMLADACYKAGQGEEGLAILVEAMAAMEESGRSDEQAEAYRLQGELLLLDDTIDGSEAEDHFQQALEIARRQEAKSFELRAATSLARLWQQQGKQAVAQELLAPVYEWFTEGFDTADLKDAKRLLDELSTNIKPLKP